MKKKFTKILAVLVLILLATGCKSPITEVTYQDINKMIKDNKTFILVVTQDSCIHCEEYKPRIKKILKKNNLTAYNLNITNISEEYYNDFKDKYDFKGTPTTMFFKKGKENISLRIIGAVNDEKIKSNLKSQGYKIK